MTNETQTNQSDICAIDAASSEILSVTQRNGDLVIQLRDGSQKLIEVGGNAPVTTFQLTSGEIYTSNDMVSLFAMAAPEEIYSESIEEATYTAYQAEQAQEENANNQPEALDAQAADGQEEAMMEALAEELAEVETAAGDEGGANSSGSGFNSSFA